MPSANLVTMTIGNLGKVLANQALESTKNTVLDAVRDPPKQPAPAVNQAHIVADIGSAITAQIQAMQRPLKDDQELAVLVRANDETLRVTEIFVPHPGGVVFAGVDPQGNITRVVSPVATAQVVCKILKVAPGATASRVNI